MKFKAFAVQRRSLGIGLGLCLSVLLVFYQACSNKPMTAQRLIQLSKQNQFFSLESRSFPACTKDRTLVLTYTKELKDTHLCLDDTKLTSEVRFGELCAAGPSITDFSTQPALEQPCAQTTLCGIVPQVTEVPLNTSEEPVSTKKSYKLTYQNLPLGCEGQLRIRNIQNQEVQIFDVETPGTKEALCLHCSNEEYSCECSGPQNAINGLCGTASGVPVPVPPTARLCVTGNLTSVVTNPGFFEWTCLGTFGGRNDHCKAVNTSYVPGVCGSSQGLELPKPPTTNLCIKGIPTTVRTEENIYLWDCTGLQGAPKAICWAKYKPPE